MCISTFSNRNGQRVTFLFFTYQYLLIITFLSERMLANVFITAYDRWNSAPVFNRNIF